MVNSLLSLRLRSLPEILSMPSTEGITRFMLVSIWVVAASSQSRSPSKLVSMGMRVSTAGNRVITFSAVIFTRLRSNPADRSFLFRVE